MSAKTILASFKNAPVIGQHAHSVEIGRQIHTQPEMYKL